MLEHYYARPRSLDRIRALWLGPAIDRYVEWLDERQAARATVRGAVQRLIHFNKFVLSRGATTWEELPSHLEPFITYWISEHDGWCRTAQDRACVHSQARIPVEQMLRLLLPDFTGTQHKVSWPFEVAVPEFFNYLLEERGLRPATLHSYRHHLRAFEVYFNRIGDNNFSMLTPTLLSTFITESAKQISGSGVTARCGVLRVFLRYLYRQKFIANDLSRSLPRGRTYRQSSIPRSISWDDAQRVLRNVDRRDQVGKRDYAMLLLLASYGLRAREIAALQLDDIDWQQAQLHISRRKGGHSTIYPLSTTIGEAIIDYLRAGRPNVENRNLFLTTKSPYTPISHWCASQRAGVYIRSAGIQVYRPGSHTFRHTCVQRLVDADVPFKVIGDYVGHRSAESTQIYGKVALHKLRSLTHGEAEEDIL